MFPVKKPTNAKRNGDAFRPILIIGLLLNPFCPLNSQEYEPSLISDNSDPAKATVNHHSRNEKMLGMAIEMGKDRNDLTYVYHLYIHLSEHYIVQGNGDKAASALDSALLYGQPCSKIEINKTRYHIEKIRGNQEKAHYYLEQAYGTLSDTASLRSAEQFAALDTRYNPHVLGSHPDTPRKVLESKGVSHLPFLGFSVLFLALTIVSAMAWYFQRRANRALKRKYQLIEQDRHSTQHEAQNQELAEDLGDLTKSETAEWLATLESATLAHIADNSFTLDGLSDTLGLSRRQVQRRLKAATGLTATAYLHETRLQQARHLLESGQVSSVKNLAAAIGMRDVKYFSQEFKKRFGKSPSKFTEQVE